MKDASRASTRRNRDAAILVGRPTESRSARRGDAPLFFAGRRESWTDKATGEIVETYTILTRTPYAAVAPFHDRSPVVLPKDRWAAWLDPSERDAKAAAKILDAPEPDLVAVPIGPEVGDVRNQGPGLVEPRRE